MRTIRLFLFFTVKSWSYQRGNRIEACKKFWTAWKYFYGMSKEDRKE